MPYTLNKELPVKLHHFKIYYIITIILKHSSSCFFLLLGVICLHCNYCVFASLDWYYNKSDLIKNKSYTIFCMNGIYLKKYYLFTHYVNK